MTIDRRIFRQADFIETAIDNVIEALRDGGLLVVLVVVLFLANFRAAAITLTAIPLSLAGAILVLRGMGATLNTMTLGGLAIAIGALVDDAIIDVENVVRRLRENRAAPRSRAPTGARDRPRRDAARSARSIVFATLHHHPGVPAGVRPVRRRGAPARAARLRLHRGAGRLAGRRDCRDAGAVRDVPAAGGLGVDRPRWVGGAPPQVGLQPVAAGDARSAAHGDRGVGSSCWSRPSPDSPRPGPPSCPSSTRAR